jgi:hypothetical protein
MKLETLGALIYFIGLPAVAVAIAIVLNLIWPGSLPDHMEVIR